MFNNITKKVILSLILWIFVWIGVFISYAIDNLSEPITDWSVLTTSWFNNVKNRLQNITDTWIYTWSIDPTKISAGTGWISITGNAATATNATNVARTWVINRPTNVSAFTNDALYITSTGITDNRVNTTGDNITWNLNVSGNIGVGTTSPWYKLDVVGTTNVDYLRVDPQDVTNEWGEMQLAWAWTNWNIQIDNFAGNIRIHTLASWKQFQVLGWSIYANGTADNYFWSNVGIGTISPSYKLDVNGTIRAGSSAILSTGGAAGYYQDTINGAYRSIVSSATTNGYYFQTNAGTTTTMYVGLGWTYNGRVGIWTNAPTAKLDIYDDTTSAAMNVRSNAGTAGIELRSNNGGNTYIDFSDDSTEDYGARIEQMRHPGNPSLGRMNFKDAVMYNFYTYDVSNSSYVTIGSSGYWGTNMGSIKIGSTASYPYYIELIDYNENAIFNNYGKVGIWTNSPLNKLDVLWDVRFGNAAYTYIVLRDDESPNGVKYIHANSNNIGFLSGAGSWLSRWDDTGKQFNTSSITATAFISSSDKRLKTNIKPLENSKDILKITPVRFDWIKDWKKDIWIIAQEVEKYFPEFVETDDKWFKAVNYPKLVIPLMKVVKEQQNEIETLKNKLDLIEKKLK